jgi:hypothetical protein
MLVMRLKPPARTRASKNTHQKHDAIVLPGAAEDLSMTSIMEDEGQTSESDSQEGGSDELQPHWRRVKE